MMGAHKITRYHIFTLPFYVKIHKYHCVAIAHAVQVCSPEAIGCTRMSDLSASLGYTGGTVLGPT